MGLPTSDGLTLSATTARVARECSVDGMAAREAIRAAGMVGRIRATGSVPLSANPDPKVREAWPHRTRQSLAGADWEADIDWEASVIGPFRAVLVDLQTLTNWLRVGSVKKVVAGDPATSRALGGKKFRLAEDALAHCYPDGWAHQSHTQIEQTVIAHLESRNISPPARDTILRAAKLRK